jgi:hypothetical protein
VRNEEQGSCAAAASCEAGGDFAQTTQGTVQALAEGWADR